MQQVIDKPLRALIVEDSEDDAQLLACQLQADGFAVDWRRVDTEPALSEVLQCPWDIVFSDYSMPHLNGMQALEIIRRHDSDIPVIFVSGTIGEETAVETMKAGAQDYVMKDNLTRLAVATKRELQEAMRRRERRQAEQSLRKLSLVVEQAADSVYITDPSGHIEYVNPAFERLTGYSRAEALGQTPSLISSGYEDDKNYRQLWETVNAGGVFRGVLINRSKNGQLFHEEKIISPLKNDQGHITHFVSTGRDITERVRADEARAQLVAILEATTDLVAILEPSGFLRYLNNAGYRLVNLDAGTDVSTLCLSNLFPERMAQRLKIEALPAARKNGTWSGETALQRTDGLEIPVSQVVLAHYGKAGDVQYLSTIVRDITERKRFEAELHHQATHDTLTQLPNRFLLADRLTTEIERMRRRNGLAAVFFLDIDNFKRINDSLGHRQGDHLLQRIAERLCTALRPNDTVARYDGDEFAILAGDLPHVDSVLVILGKIRAAFERPVSIDAQDAYVSFSIGIAVYPHDGAHVDELLRNAGTAMYRAKSAGPNQYRLYTPEMNARSHERLTLESELRHAYKHNEFVLHYQPQVTLGNRKITAAEGLIRWQHPQRGLVSPADFVPLLEETGLIIPVGEWVFRQACRDFRETGLQDLRVSVNVSVAQFSDADLLDNIQRALKEECVPPKALELEITENILIKDPAATREILEALHALGIRIAIDDFGTGYSSLAYLKRLPLDVLKIDQSFIHDLSHDAGDAAIVEASISLGKKLGMEVIAEGVETKTQFDLLHKLDCDMVQGYYISRPLPKTQFSDLLKNKPSW